jgi:hypothetical protein
VSGAFVEEVNAATGAVQSKDSQGSVAVEAIYRF